MVPVRLEKDGPFEEVFKVLDGNFSYDERVQFPNEFEGYFNLL